MIKTLYKMWVGEIIDLPSTDDEFRTLWVKKFIKFADKIITPKKKGDRVGFTSGRRHFKIIRDK